LAVGLGKTEEMQPATEDGSDGGVILAYTCTIDGDQQFAISLMREFRNGWRCGS
jgi:hypothetical protein